MSKLKCKKFQRESLIVLKITNKNLDAEYVEGGLGNQDSEGNRLWHMPFLWWGNWGC